MNLNVEQEACVAARDGVTVAVSGPGSGKTAVLIERHSRMVASGISPKNILNLTFTNSAAKEMVERAGYLEVESVFRTFHSFAIDLLKKERSLLPFKLCDTIIPVAMEDYKLLFDLVKQYPAIKDFRTLQDRISSWKKELVTPDEALKVAEGDRDGSSYFYALAYGDYENRCRDQGWLDFDSVMQEAVELLENIPEVRERHKRKYISVDECQDTDITQFRMLKALFSGNIFAVGDENQGVYEWRSAQPGNLTNFARIFPGAKTLFLGQNYRSTKRLVEFFKKIVPVDNGIASHMFTENEEGIDPTFVRYPDADTEVEQVLAAITDPVNTAIIARTNRQLFVFQRVCTIRGIKYKILGKKDFWELNEVKKLLGLAKETHDSRPAAAVLSDLIQQHNLLNVYKHAGRPMESNPADNLRDVVKMSAKRGTIDEFLNYLRKLTGARRSVKGLTLSTVHQSKGREFKHVFIIGAHQGMMPHRDGELNEERRIFFVACTRAADTLQISFFKEPSMFLNDFRDQIEETDEGEFLEDEYAEKDE